MSDEKFSPTETGITNALTRCVVTCTDDGRVVIMAGDKAGIVIDEETGVVTIFGTEIRFASEDITINGKRLRSGSLGDKSRSLAVGTQVRLIDKAKE